MVERVGYAARAGGPRALVQRLRGQEADVVLHTGAPDDESLLFFRAMRGRRLAAAHGDRHRRRLFA